MKKNLKYVLSFRILVIVVLFILSAGNVSAQKIVLVHKTEKKETVFGIAKQYGVTIEELSNANPAMREPDFMLKKGMMINIPEHVEKNNGQSTSAHPAESTAKTTAQTVAQKKETKTITLGVMLPLHDINGDGKRMVEYYRGILLAVRELKQLGYNITVNAWNLAEGDDAHTVLQDRKAQKCDVIFGPLYTAQVPALSEFCVKHKIRLVIPFSINGEDVKTCPQIFQVYQTPFDLNNMAIEHFASHFKDYHPVFIDCNDTQSKKGVFTFGLRKVLEEKGIEYKITNLNNSPEYFAGAFSRTKRNIVVLNTGRSPELGQVFKKLEEMCDANSSIRVSMFGYNEWFLYTGVYDQKFRRFDTYIPSTYDCDMSSPRAQSLSKLYETQFHTPMQFALPRFALTGYDQAMYFVRGIEKYGRDFCGSAAQKNYNAVQTPYVFEKQGNGGYQNRSFMLVHYK